ncbi:MAG: aldo/keto reductase [Candidatus Nanopelagicaceae bacterium]|nr:aldo/keto reductase [Candidatus Nanopelagicaceae bacterium]
MKYRNLGRSGLSVSRICLGTMNFGPEADEATSHSIMDSAIDSGVNFFDTANRYGGADHWGHTEEIIGNWFAKGGQRREKVVLATKLYGETDTWPNNKGVSALNIRRACDASLKRLKTDYIDLYQMHHIDRATPWEEVWQAMEVLVAQGKILYVGSSNFGGWHLAQAQERATARNFMGLISEQSIYNLFQRDIEREVIPAALQYGIGILPWSPLHGGLLGGVIKKENEGSRRLQGRSTEALETHRSKIEAYENFCVQIKQEPGEVALAWLLAQPAVTAPIVGPRTQEQFDSALRALTIDLSTEDLAKLDEIFPGYKTSPEDYAW